MDISNLHEIQLSILEKLGYEEEKTFSELQGDLPSNKLAFHLNQLQEMELIEKIGSEYTTTKNGREVIIEFLGDETTNPVTLLSVIIEREGEVYLEKQTSSSSIFKGMYRLPTDKVRKRERLKQTAERIYRERIGEEPSGFQNLGVFDKKVTLKDGVEQKYLLFYLKADYMGGKKQNFVDLEELDRTEMIPGVEKVVKEAFENENKCFTGEWNVEQGENGFKITRFDL